MEHIGPTVDRQVALIYRQVEREKYRDYQRDPTATTCREWLRARKQLKAAERRWYGESSS